MKCCTACFWQLHTEPLSELMLLEKLWAVSEDASVEQIRMLSSFCHRMGVTGSLIFLAPPNTSRLCGI